MPIPKPSKGEREKEFISRCMGNPIMTKDYPDAKQRAGVCYSSWREKKMSEEKKDDLCGELDSLSRERENEDRFFKDLGVTEDS